MDVMSRAISEKFASIFPKDVHFLCLAPLWVHIVIIINIHARRPPSAEEFITRNTAHEDIIYKISVQYSFLHNYPEPLGHIRQLNISHNKSRVMGFFNAYVVKFYFNHLWHSFTLFYDCMSE